MKNLVLLFTSLLMLGSCDNKSFQDGEAELLSLHQQQREAHFSEDAQSLVDQLAENFLSVNHGRIDSLNRANDVEGFEHYFRVVEFKKWDDINPPVVRFSDDGSMAYMVVDKNVVVESTDSAGNKNEETTHFAWVAIFKKQESGWKIECVASTNEPREVKQSR
jgi:hypothetical protein